MEWINGMNAAINYIEENILEEINYCKLGQLAGCSPSHFQRIFTYLSGVTLKEYVKRRRMSLAATELADNSTKVIDVALKYGYSSPTAFTRAFADIHGVTPSEVKDGVKIVAFPPMKFQMVVKGVTPMNYRIEKKEAFRVLGKSIELKQSIEENFKITPEFWAKSSMDGTVQRLAGMIENLGLLGISTCNNTDEWRYYIAVATTQEADDLEEYVVPACTWAIFPKEGPISGMQELENQIVTEWLPTSGYEYANGPDVEVYLNPDPANAKYEVWIPVMQKQRGKINC